MMPGLDGGMKKVRILKSLFLRLNPTCIDSVFPLDEKSFLCFQHLALRTPPSIRKSFKGGPRRNSSFGISY